MRKLAILTAAALAAVLLFLFATLPPRPLPAAWHGDPSIPARTVAGAYHVHTTRSDGAKDKAAVAAAAARAGLQFVLFTEHGDGTTPPDPPVYTDGVLCLDGVEISTNGGHYTAIDLPQTPYSLGGEAATVVEDVRRFGGFGFIAHPDSPKPDLAWTDWTLPFDGVEWVNADSEWRNEPRFRMLRVLFDYMIRPGPALASLLDRPVMTLTRWDALTTRRAVVGMAGHDAHGGFGVGTEGGSWWGVPLPSYEASFRTFTTRVLLDAPWRGDAGPDARALVDAIRAGRTYTVIDAIAAPGYLDFRREGDAAIVAEASMPPGAEIVILHAEGPVAGREVVRSGESRHVMRLPSPRGAYRLEVRVASAPGSPPIPWLVSNPIQFLPPALQPHLPHSPPEPIALPSALTWHAEHDPSSRASLADADGKMTLTYELGGGEPQLQFVAAAAPLPDGTLGFDSLVFDGTASRPTRVSVQLRYEDEQRWGLSLFLDGEARRFVVDVDDLLPLEGQATRPPDPATARSVLVVVDLVNARPGDRGEFRIENLTPARRP